MVKVGNKGEDERVEHAHVDIVLEFLAMYHGISKTRCYREADGCASMYVWQPCVEARFGPL